MFFLTLKLVRFFVKLLVKLVALPFRILKALVGVAGGSGTGEAPNEPVGGDPVGRGPGEYAEPPPESEYAEPPPESEYAAPPPGPQDGAPPPEPRDGGPPPEPRNGAPRAEPPHEAPPPEPRRVEPPREGPPPEPRGGEPPAEPREESQHGSPPPEPRQGESPRQEPQGGAPPAETREGSPPDPDPQAGQRSSDGHTDRAEVDPGEPEDGTGADLRPDSADLDLDAMRPSEVPVTAADGRVVRHLVERLDSDDATVRREAVTKLGEIGAEQPSLVDPVTGEIERCRLDPDRDVVDAAADALDELPDESGRAG